MFMPYIKAHNNEAKALIHGASFFSNKSFLNFLKDLQWNNKICLLSYTKYTSKCYKQFMVCTWIRHIIYQFWKRNDEQCSFCIPCQMIVQQPGQIHSLSQEPKDNLEFRDHQGNKTLINKIWLTLNNEKYLKNILS